MSLKKFFLRSVLVVVIVALFFAVRYAWRSFPVISGYGAKNLCSAVYLQHRNPADVIREDLGDFPLSLGTFSVNEKDSTVTGKVWGMAVKKAIYRAGCGCTLVNEIPEKEIRAQQAGFVSSRPAGLDTIPWPSGDRVDDSIPVQVNKPALDKILDESLTEETDGRPAHTRAILVVYDGQLVGEKYAPGFDRNTVMLGWSVSKSLTAAMIGILVKEGKLDINAPAPVPEWKGTDKERITLKQILQHTTGLDFEENYTKYCDVTNMLFNKGDMAAYAAHRPLRYEPGKFFYYSSGNSNILSRIIRQTVGEAGYPAFPYRSLFQKAGMYSAILEPDASGTYIGSSYSYATARDFARFGLLCYNNGKSNGEQLLPDDWIRQSTEPVPADPYRHYGFQFWLNGKDEKDPAKKWYPSAPDDMFFADGYGGQDIYIIPSRKLVIVRLGLHVINENRLLGRIMEVIK